MKNVGNAHLGDLVAPGDAIPPPPDILSRLILLENHATRDREKIAALENKVRLGVGERGGIGGA